MEIHFTQDELDLIAIALRFFAGELGSKDYEDIRPTLQAILSKIEPA